LSGGRRGAVDQAEPLFDVIEASGLLSQSMFEVFKALDQFIDSVL
jgi:hypothetical protein